MYILILSTLLLGNSPQVQAGRQLFFNPGISDTGVACGTCHAVVEDEAQQGDGLIRSGHTLFGAARRPYWRGDTKRQLFPDLGRALEECVRMFMGGKSLGKVQNQNIVQYITSISPKRNAPAVKIEPALVANEDYNRPEYQGGNADRGRDLFYRACHSCHPHGGQGVAPAIQGREIGAIVHGVREGNGLLRGKLRQGGWMPFFGRNRLPSSDLKHIAAYIQLLPQTNTRTGSNATQP